jgi:hypothetical protein
MRMSKQSNGGRICAFRARQRPFVGQQTAQTELDPENETGG